MTQTFFTFSPLEVQFALLLAVPATVVVFVVLVAERFGVRFGWPRGSRCIMTAAALIMWATVFLFQDTHTQFVHWSLLTTITTAVAVLLGFVGLISFMMKPTRYA